MSPNRSSRVVSQGGGGGGGAGPFTSSQRKEGRGEGARVKKVKGRWTSQEHHKFLAGLERFGKDWKAIGGAMQTRTVVQVRTHAQKYFLKTERGRAFPEEPYESAEDGGRTDSSGFGSCSSDSESSSLSSSSSGQDDANNETENTITTLPSPAVTAMGNAISNTIVHNPCRSSPLSLGLHFVDGARDGDGGVELTSPRRSECAGGGTSSTTTRGKRLACLGGGREGGGAGGESGCSLAARRATRASSAAAAAAAFSSAIQEKKSHPQLLAGGGVVDALGGEGQQRDHEGGNSELFHQHFHDDEGLSDGSGDMKRFRIERPAPADIISENNNGHGGHAGSSCPSSSLAAAVSSSPSPFYSSSASLFQQQSGQVILGGGDRFRGKRISSLGKISAAGGGQNQLPVSDFNSGGGGRLEINTTFMGACASICGPLSPATMDNVAPGKADSAVWSTVGDMKANSADSGEYDAGVLGWVEDVGLPNRAKSPFFGEHFLEELLVGDNANNEEEAATALLSASSPHCGAAEEDHDRVTSAVDATPAARSSFLAVEEDKEQQQLQEPQHQQEQQQQHSTPVSPANQCLEFEYRDIGSAGNSGYPDAAAAETGGTAQTASNRLSNSTSASNSLAFPFGSLACGSITPSSSEIGVFGDGGSGTSGGSSVHSGLTDGVCFAKVGDIFEGIGDGGGSGGLAVAESFPVDDAAAAGAAADSPRQLGLFSYPTAAGGENAVPIDKTVPIEKTDEIDKTNEIDETATDEAGPPLSRLLQQQIGDATPTAHDGLIGGAIDGGCKANAVVGASLGGDVEGGPLGEDWLSYDDVPGGIAAGAGEQGEDDGLSGVEADDGADAMDVIFAFEDHFGML